MSVQSVYLASTLDLLEVYNVVRAQIEAHDYTLVCPHAASLEQRLTVDEIESNMQRADAVVFLINGTGVGSEIVECEGWNYHPVEAEWETGNRITDRIHAVLPSGAWYQRLLEDATFKGSMRYRLRTKAELSGKCTFCESPQRVPDLVLQWLETGNANMLPDQSSVGRVFLCHASEDKKVVYDVYRKLKVAGFSPWLDKEDLLPGMEWAKEIPKVLRQSACVLVFLSSNSVGKRGYVQREFKLTIDTLDEIPEGQIFLIPILIDHCSVPDSFQRFQWIRLYEPGGFDRILKSVKFARDAYEASH